MRSIPPFLAVFFFILPLMAAVIVFLMATPARADLPPAHATVADDVWTSVARAAGNERAERARIMRVLELPVTREVAASHGFDLAAAEARVGVLHGAELERASATAALAEREIGAPGALVITEYGLIIILLVLIILLLV